jgi:hypothetical protein
MNNFLKLIIAPISRFISFFSKPEDKVTSLEFIALKADLKDGDILFSRTDWELSNIFMPGYWKHCAIYLDGHVYEAVTKGVRKTLLEEFFFKKDHVGLGRYGLPLSIESQQVTKAYLETKLGAPYDWSFEMGIKNKFYCSELVYYFLNIAYDDFAKNFIIRISFKQPIIRPTDMWNALKQIGRWN